MLADILGYNPKAPTMIGKLSIDIMRQYEYQLDQEVTAHPVETGFEIHDTAINHPVKVTMVAGISSHPVTWFYVNGIGQSKFADGLDALKAIRDAKQPVTIVRPDKIWKDMFLTSCRPLKSDESKSVIWVDLSFQQIDKVTVQTTEVPEDIVDASVADSAGATAADGGQATQTDIGTLQSANNAQATEAVAETADNRTLLAQGSDYASEVTSEIVQDAKNIANAIFGKGG